MAAPRAARGWAGHLWEQVFLPLAIRPGEVLWSPANSGPLVVSRQVVTIHDAAVFDHPEWFRPAFVSWYQALLPHLARRAAAVLTSSHFSRRRLAAALSLPEDRIRVAVCGVDRHHFSPAPRAAVQAMRRKYRLADNYILFVGSFEPRKNLARLLAAWEQASPRLTGFELLLCGQRSARVHPDGLPGLPPATRMAGYVPDQDLPALYSGALCLALPSLEEGAGLTALEAAACGTPVLAARSGALPETLGQAGFYIDPLDEGTIAVGLAELAGDNRLRARLSAAGQELAASRGWEQTSAAVLAALNEAGRR